MMLKGCVNPLGNSHHFVFCRDLNDIGAKNIDVHALRKASILKCFVSFGYCLFSLLSFDMAASVGRLMAEWRKE